MKLFSFGLFLILMIFLYGCNINDRNTTTKLYLDSLLNYQNNNLRYLDSLGYKSFYQESKWKIYLKYCDEIIDKDGEGNKLKKERLFGETNLVLRIAGCFKDSLIGIYFFSILDDTMNITEKSFKKKDLRYTLFLSHFRYLKNGQFFGYGVGDFAILNDSVKLNNYCNDVPKCNKIEFIEKNRTIFDKWFIEEAERRKFIKKE